MTSAPTSHRLLVARADGQGGRSRAIPSGGFAGKPRQLRNPLRVGRRSQMRTSTIPERAQQSVDSRPCITGGSRDPRKTEADKFLFIQITSHLATLEEKQGNNQDALAYMEMWKTMSFATNEVQQRIDELRQKIPPKLHETNPTTAHPRSMRIPCANDARSDSWQPDFKWFLGHDKFEAASIPPASSKPNRTEGGVISFDQLAGFPMDLTPELEFNTNRIAWANERVNAMIPAKSNPLTAKKPR